MKSSTTTATPVLLFISLVGLVLVSSDSSLQTKCSPYVSKLGQCLNFATAKEDTPSSDCCGSVTEIRNKDPVCLCYVIQQAHSTTSTVNTLGLRIDRLIQLPAACKLANTNITDCTKLLNLSPSSPDYAIFTNTTKATATPTGSSSSSTSSPDSGGIAIKVNFAGGIFFTIAVVFAFFCLSF